VSHDLRTPLQAMDSFSKKLAEKYSYQLDSEGQWLIAVVRDGTRRMAQLINDIIAFSRIGRVALNTRIVSMAQLGQDVLLELDPIIGQRDVGLSIGTLPPAEGDAVTPRRVWMNLL
jgi:light-regulated signal transduction histidine kinase (bacteriophytochrome)